MLNFYVHNKHNSDWSDKSYDKIITITKENIDDIINNIVFFNTIDYDIMISKGDNIPNNENNIGMHKVDISIRENYERTMTKFIDIIRMFMDGKLDKYNPKFISLIVKTDVFCIRFVSEKYDDCFNYIIHSISGEENEKTCMEFHNLISNTQTFRKQKVLTKPIYRKKFINGTEDTMNTTKSSFKQRKQKH